MADKTPYGDVSYADPGYQSDKKKRYPLDSEAHCRAAWSYVNMPKNAAMYTSSQVSAIKSRIKAAGRKYGITFSDDVKAAASGMLFDVELARPGSWNLKTGKVTFTEAMLRDAADFFEASGGQAVPVKLGHDDPRFDGDPTFGSLTNVRYTEDDRGPVLMGDVVDMPGWLAAAAPQRWPNRSIEGWQNFDYEGRTYSLVLSGLAFLGVTPPGVRNIQSLSDMQLALAASNAQLIVAAAPDDDPAAAPQTPAPVADVATDESEAGLMDPVKIREALGLAADASDDAVKAAMLQAAGAPPSTPETKPEQPPLPGLDPAPAAPRRQLVNAAGTVQADPSMLAEQEERMKRLEARLAKQDRNERDQIIAQAVVDGKFAPYRRDHWVQVWDADPEGARQMIDGLARNLVPVMASGYAGDGDEDIDAEYAHLFPPTGKKA
jgi:hypothetical protein